MNCRTSGFLHSPLSSGVCSNSCSLCQWCYVAISSSTTLFSFCLQSFPASGVFPKNRLFASGDQSVGALASASTLPINIQGWFLCSTRDSQESSPAPQFKNISLQCSAFLMVQLSHPYITNGEKNKQTNSFNYIELCWQKDVSDF